MEGIELKNALTKDAMDARGIGIWNRETRRSEPEPKYWRKGKVNNTQSPVQLRARFTINNVRLAVNYFLSISQSYMSTYSSNGSMIALCVPVVYSPPVVFSSPTPCPVAQYSKCKNAVAMLKVK